MKELTWVLVVSFAGPAVLHPDEVAVKPRGCGSEPRHTERQCLPLALRR